MLASGFAEMLLLELFLWRRDTAHHTGALPHSAALQLKHRSPADLCDTGAKPPRDRHCGQMLREMFHSSLP
jgi:hypothetical protein